MTTDNFSYEEPMSTNDNLLSVEQYGSDTSGWQYKSTREQLLCWGEDSNYLDSEFSNELESDDQGNLDETDYDDSLEEDQDDFEEDESDEDDAENDFDENISK